MCLTFLLMVALISPLDSAASGFDTTITGSVYIRFTNQPYSHLVVWLADVVCPQDSDTCFYLVDAMGSPSTFTDEQGVFTITNIHPARYVIIFGTLPPDGYLYDREVVTDNLGSPKAWSVSIGTVTNTGQLFTKLRPGGGSIFELFAPLIVR